MGSSVSSKREADDVFGDDDVQTELDALMDVLTRMNEGEKNELLIRKLQETTQEAIAIAGEEEPIRLLIASPDTAGVNIMDFEKKREAKKKFLKKKSHGKTCVLVKNGTVEKKYCCGDPKIITLLIGIAFGQKASDLGPLDDNEFPDLQIFVDDGEDEDEDDGGDSDEEEEEEKFVLWQMKRSGKSVRSFEFKKGKKAKKKFENKEESGTPCILTKNGELERHTVFDDEKQNRVMLFLIGLCFGAGNMSDLGPCNDADSPLCCLEPIEQDDDAVRGILNSNGVEDASDDLVEQLVEWKS
uniref:Uncharacterized protein n=1 Tax=Florenciella parvula TaxID=236787 RepID=A0A7S2FKB0_9STRA